MKTSIRRNGFTMVELLFVIVIMGVVGGFALDTVRQYYENIFRTNEYSQKVADADHILEQLSKYFEMAVNDSIVNLDETTAVCFGTPGINTGDFTVAFVAVDEDSLRGNNGLPGWNEDTLLQNNNVLNAPDANYAVANAIITALYPTSNLLNSAIYDADSMNVDACTRFNWNGGGGGQGYYTINAIPTNTTLLLNAGKIATDGKQKYLMRTAYAFRVLDNGDFKMYSNFRPWLGEGYATASRQNILGQNVAHFSINYNAQDFQNNANLNDRGMIWRLKVCMVGMDANLSESVSDSQQICRERSVHVRY